MHLEKKSGKIFKNKVDLNNMKILSIETSCDETGISLLEVKGGKFKLLANELSSQIKIHAPYGGVFPALAKREHIKNLPLLFEKILKKVRRQGLTTFDLITVTSGPGLEPALWTGIVFAKELALKYKVPIIPVNHMEGHILSVFGNNKKEFAIPNISFPVLSLLVSGGHTELVLVKDWGKYQIIGQTLDDACGEAFDKVARMMELPYPGGPEISKLAQRARTTSQIQQNSAALPSLRGLRHGPNFAVSALPRPMMYSKNFDFSFSGLKTAVLYLIRDLKKENPKILEDIEVKKAIALEFENAVVEVLIHKTKKAIEKYKVNTLIVAGGVSANKHLKNEIKKSFGKTIKTFFPDAKLTGDNAVMIGMAGYMKYLRKGKKGVRASSIKAEGNMRL